MKKTGLRASTLMVSQKTRQSNINNSKLSTGPRTARGKQNSRMNAVRHGLGMQFGLDPSNSEKIQELATVFAEGSESFEVQGYARLLAEACLDLKRIEL